MREYRVKPVRSLARGLRVLRVLQEMRAASLHDLHLATGIPKASLTRILHTCHREGLVWQRMADGAFLPSHIQQRRAKIDDAEWLVEIASPVLKRLCEQTRWPSVLSVPRLDYMETIETNSPLAYFDDVMAKPVGFRVNMLRSASGRAYLAFCADEEREAVLRRLRERDVAGHELAHDGERVRRIVEQTRRRGYSVRAPDFGGDYGRPRAESDDGRNSIAVPLRVAGQVLGCVNLTWRLRVMSAKEAARRHLPELRAAVREIEEEAARS
ncbi:transcriptional regulator [Saccharomonospora marina XMU15]|uniref:Transcriptional regulator n=1 Tax=Saccharomonospora marina XMU15 TaxID=882083 RepID=H5X8L5_9PSEU|nr:helix-turn-helix domain-containing protein [Saccharomonospora marina]EHR51384.1 transcriptional regulator [Saccharomonospora marina XMU15]